MARRKDRHGPLEPRSEAILRTIIEEYVATALPVGEVGRLVGYPDPGYFARVFGRAHGASPARWRGAGR